MNTLRAAGFSAAMAAGAGTGFFAADALLDTRDERMAKMEKLHFTYPMYCRNP